MTERINPSTDAEQPQDIATQPRGQVSSDHVSLSPRSLKGAPPPYADQERRRASHERHEETARVKPRKVIGNFTLTNTLGAGSMGKVKLAVHNLTNEKVDYGLLDAILWNVIERTLFF
jgi:serine/threonine protein kinase